VIPGAPSMKIMLLTLLSWTGLMTMVGFPAEWTPNAANAATTAPGVFVETDVQSSHICQLLVVTDKHTVLDRGSLRTLDEQQRVVGSFRYWAESAGRVLYVYDETQSLVCRINNPVSVVLLDLVD